MSPISWVMSKIFRYYGPGGTLSGGIGPGFQQDTYDYKAEAGVLHQNGIISSIISYVVRKAGEASIEPYAFRNGQWQLLPNPSIRNIWHNPNSYHGFPELVSGIVTSLYDDGNAYLIKRRNGLGRLIGLNYVSHNQMTPKCDQDNPEGLKLISHYMYRPIGGAEERFEVEEVIHFRWGIDINNPAMGCTPFIGAFRDIALDNSAAVSAGALLRNGGRPGVIFSPKVTDAPPPTVDQRKAIEKLWDTFVRDKSGKAFFTPFPMEVTTPGMSPQELEILAIREQTSSRICAPVGIDVMTINLPGPHKTYANYAEANEAGLENCFLQIAGIIAQQFTHQTRMDYLGFDADTFKWGWNTDQMRGLMGDLESLHQRVRSDWEKELIDLYEARQMLNLPVDDTMKGVMYEPKVASGTRPDESPGKPAKKPQDSIGRPKSDDVSRLVRSHVARAVEELNERLPVSS